MAGCDKILLSVFDNLLLVYLSSIESVMFVSLTCIWHPEDLLTEVSVQMDE